MTSSYNLYALFLSLLALFPREKWTGIALLAIIWLIWQLGNLTDKKWTALGLAAVVWQQCFDLNDKVHFYPQSSSVNIRIPIKLFVLTLSDRLLDSILCVCIKVASMMMRNGKLERIQVIYQSCHCHVLWLTIIWKVHSHKRRENNQLMKWKVYNIGFPFPFPSLLL